MVNRDLGDLDAAAADFRAVLRWDRPPTPEMAARGFDFGRDYRVANLLGRTYHDLARRERGADRAAERTRLLRMAVDAFEHALAADVENVAALDNLARLHAELGEPDRAAGYRTRHERHRPDDLAAARALRLAKERYPHAAAAAEPVTVYPLVPATRSEPRPSGSVTRTVRDAP